MQPWWPVSIATVLGVREVAGEALQDSLARRIGDREVVLVLDNLEQFPAAGSVIAGLLAASPGLRVLATSRAPLHVRGEQEYRLAPLRLPGPAELASLEDLAEVEAVKLFVERARAIDPAFALTSENAVAVAGICARLDGLPLAIELAAARTRLFTPTALLGRLDRRLPVLTEGPMDAPIRQRTLRSTIGWSFDLLSERDQRSSPRWGCSPAASRWLLRRRSQSILPIRTAGPKCSPASTTWSSRTS